MKKNKAEELPIEEFANDNQNIRSEFLSKFGKEKKKFVVKKSTDNIVQVDHKLGSDPTGTGLTALKKEKVAGNNSGNKISYYRKKGVGVGKVEKVMKEFKNGSLKDSHGKIITNRKQAIAIALSEAGISKNIKVEDYVGLSDEALLKSDIFKSKYVIKGHKDQFAKVIGNNDQVVDNWNMNNLLKFDPNIIDWGNIQVIDNKQGANVTDVMKTFINKLQLAKNVKEAKKLASDMKITKGMWTQFLSGMPK